MNRSTHQSATRAQRSVIPLTCAIVVFAAGTFSPLSASLAVDSPPPPARRAPAEPLNRTDVDQLLQKARSAMAAGKIQEAEKLLARAEEAKVRYPVLHFGDTPARLRRDIKKYRTAPGQQTNTPTSKNQPATATRNPFLLNEPGTGKAPQLQTALPAEQQSSSAATQVDIKTTSANGTPTTNGIPRGLRSPSDAQRAEYQAPPAAQGQNGKPQGSISASNLTGADLTIPSFGQDKSLPLELAQASKATEIPSNSPVDQGEQLLPLPSSPFDLLQAGEQALRGGDRNEALQIFRSAHAQRDLLDPLSRQQLQDHLQMLSSRRIPAERRDSSNSLISAATEEQTIVARQLSAEVGKRQTEASQLRSKDPQAALEILTSTSKLIEESSLEPGMKAQLDRRVGLSISETQEYISNNQAALELSATNQSILDDIDREREVRLQVQQRLAELVQEYSTLRDEQRYAQAEVVAKRAYEMAPDDLVAQTIWANAKFLRRTMLNKEIDELTEGGVWEVIKDVRATGGHALADSTSPITYGDSWPDVVARRQKSGSRSRRQTESELEIRRKLRTPVLPRYKDMPLTEVIDAISNLSGINIHLDPRGLSQEGVRSDEHVSLSFPREISLASALELILEPLHLTYVIKNEVLKITSEQIRDGELVTETYNVADLVIPIPNFVPSSNMGLAGLLEDAYDALPVGIGGSSGNGPTVVMAGNQPAQPGAPFGANVMPQQIGGGGGNSAIPIGGLPGSPGGAANADFDSLIDLIVSTVEHESWMENGTGEGEIQPFPTNLSLVISQTQNVHEQIADLLAQLRRLQDLQVTIEVRFIRLTDKFFERIGIDFDFNIEDGTEINDLNDVNSTFDPGRSSATVGLTANPLGLGSPLGTFTADLDVPIRQNSFTLAAPAFGTPQTVGQFGFAILSDIEAFFLIEASQGDQRSNVLQAPKVTLFNGQQANVIDAAQVPFVISVVPVVGEFAAAQQPVIVVLSEGTMLTVQAVVSDDRRYVRLTLVPFFSTIGDVKTFTFEGSETTTTSSNTTDQDGDGNNESTDAADTIVRSGTTVQLPTFEVISIATTVSVPDGGTVLLGGIKRLREGRNEFGVPLLSKLPYVDRLFRNVGIGRETDSLMMMVTPHIIIQEEEEERRGIATE
ncbi:MAG: general secretion pathway protein GspD [Pirellulales bacterium]|nr:general secretion pathway protein GspD [Pirellulales bacterium]